MSWFLSFLILPIVQGIPLDAPKYLLHEVSFKDLAVLDSSTIVAALNELITVGAIEISNIPGYASAREEALRDLGICLFADDFAAQTTMNDGSSRRSSAALSIAGVPQSMSSECGLKSSKLRAVTDTAIRQLFYALDKSMDSSLFQDSDYKFEDIVKKGEHLEHLHAYYESIDSTEFIAGTKPTMEMHTDAGLFIAMTSSMYITENHEIETNTRNGLFLQLPSGTIVEALVSDSDSLIFMVGDGAARWLLPSLGAPLRAVPHAMVGNMHHGATRNWYGKMYLPPANAILRHTNGLTYARYRQLEIKAASSATNSHELFEYLPLACGGGYMDNLEDGNDGAISESSTTSSYMLMNTQCDNGNGVYCWNQCVSIAAYPCGNQAECVDPATGQPVDGTTMCPSVLGMEACELQCVSDGPTDVNITSSDDFCIGTGTIMFMDGFNVFAGAKEGTVFCVNLLFKDWTLDSNMKYTLGCLGVVVFGIFIEMLSYLRRHFYDKLPDGPIRNITMLSFHAVQVCSSYLIMLVTMTYSVELFCMVVIGLTIGHGMFNVTNAPPDKVDPCCAVSSSASAKKVAYEDGVAMDQSFTQSFLSERKF